eukprot:TRINITY_DN897_c0_g1_i1.p1 TRINITY_DN897_c0_g1~~TRINITY_DN897_c0_g1_i1.p1  ORF type:complete len:632 (-),score=110.65 TRINITY_DN897_c0_g1_i1:638-2416(-)
MAGDAQALLAFQHKQLLQVLESWLASQEERLSRLLVASSSRGGVVTPPREATYPSAEGSLAALLANEEVAARASEEFLVDIEDDGFGHVGTSSTATGSQSVGSATPEKHDRVARSRSHCCEVRQSAITEHLQTLEKEDEEAPPHKAIAVCEEIVRHPGFEPCFAIMILVNSVITFLEVHMSLESATAEAPAVFTPVGHLMGAIFLVELLLRIAAQRRAFFSSSNFSWNCFDLSLVASWLVEFVVDIVHASGSSKASSQNSGLSNMRLFRILRIARLIRLLRIARILRFVRALNLLILSILTTLRSLVWASVLLLLIIFTFAIYICQNVADSIRDCTRDDCTMDPELARYWGTVPTASLSLFQIISGGKNWDDVARPLMELSGFLLGVLLIFIVFAQFAVLNVVTGVFCQAAVESAQRDRELMVHSMHAKKKQIVAAISEQFTTMFRASGKSHGALTVEAFEEYVNAKSVQEHFALLEIDTSDAFMLFQLIDEDASGTIDVEEFVDGCLRLKGTARSIDLAKLSKECKQTSQQFQVELVGLQGQLKELHKLLEKRSLAAASWNCEPQFRLLNHDGRTSSRQASITLSEEEVLL